MSYDFQYSRNILDIYQCAWDFSSYDYDNSLIRKCEEELIKTDKQELEGFLKKFVTYMRNKHRDSYTNYCCFYYDFIDFPYQPYYYQLCVLLHLIRAFCIPGQEDKIRLVQVNLNELLQSFTEKTGYLIFERYLSQRLEAKSRLTEIDMLTGKIDSQHCFQLKLCCWDIIYKQNNSKGCREFLQKNAVFLVSNTEEAIIGKFSIIENMNWGCNQPTEKWLIISCNVLLCLLNGNMRTTQPSATLQNTEAPASSSVNFLSDTPNNYSFLEDRVSKILYKLLSTLSEDDIFTVFNDYLDQMFALKSEIIEDDFCTGRIEPYHEFLLKLCYCEKLCNNNDETCLTFLRRNASFLVAQIKNMVDRDLPRFKFIFWKILPSLLNFYYQKTPSVQDQTKKQQTNLLASLLSQSSTNLINEDFYPYFEKSCACNPIFMLQLAETFLDISINPEISQHKKSTFKDKVQTMLIYFYDTNKQYLEPTTKFTESMGKTLDHKRIINICFNIVKMRSEDIDLSIYEQFYCTESKAIENEVEMIKRSQETESLVLLMLLLITITCTGHHKSAKLKKYLSLKYEYATASLYLLWSSGDIEVHPGPSLNKKTLAHDSSIERRWIQNITPKIIIRLPDHEQSKYKPTKKERNDRENREHFKILLKTCLEEKVHVPKMYLAEINAWETMEYKLLHRLFVYRCEFETIIASLQDFLTCGGSTNKLTAINITFDTELQTNEITTILGKDQRPIHKSQLMVYITRHIAGISIKCAHGKDPDSKCDKLWDLPLKHWPKHIILFDPNNRGKYSKKYPGQKLIPDQELVDMLLSLPQVTIPQKYEEIVDAFRTMRKSQKDKSINNQHKAELCSTFKRITSLEKLDYAIKNLWESEIFTEEVHNNLNKWWTTGAVDTKDDQNVSQVDIIKVQKRRRPHILINISANSITFTVEQTGANCSQVSYDFPFNDELVPLKTMATTVHQTTILKPSSDSHQMVTAKKYLTVSSKQDACPADNQTYSIIIPPLGLYPNGHAILESDIKHPHKISTEETALCSTIDLDQPTSSTKQISQLSQNIATPNQSTTNSDDTSSATKDSQSLDFHTQVSPTSDMGSSDSISSVNSKSGNEDGDQINIPNGGQVILTDSDYSSDISNNCVSKTNIQKRKLTEQDRNEMKKRKIPPLKQDKKPKETNHRHMDCLMDNTATFNKNREILPDWLLDIDLDSYDIDDQTFKVDLNALDNEDTELGKFLQDMIDCESEKNDTNEII